MARPEVGSLGGQIMEATEGYDQLEERRRSKFDKQIANKVLLGSGGLDEGVDRQLRSET